MKDDKAIKPVSDQQQAEWKRLQDRARAQVLAAFAPRRITEQSIEFEIELRRAMLGMAEQGNLPQELYRWYEGTTLELAKQEALAGRLPIDPVTHAVRSFNGFRLAIPEWAFTPAVPGIH